MATIRLYCVRILILACVLWLSGCSGAPDAGDLQPLLQQHLRTSMQDAQSAVRALGGEQGVDFMRALGAPEPDNIKVENVKVLESRELDNGDYEMEIRYDLAAGEHREIKTTTVRLDKADSGWRLLPD